MWIAEGWLYLSALVDSSSRRVVGWAMDAVCDTPLVAAAKACALQQRHPAPGLLHHTDRGSQYTSATYQAMLGQHGTLLSMSRKADCWDNAVMESFLGQ